MVLVLFFSLSCDISSHFFIIINISCPIYLSMENTIKMQGDSMSSLIFKSFNLLVINTYYLKSRLNFLKSKYLHLVLKDSNSIIVVDFL